MSKIHPWHGSLILVNQDNILDPTLLATLTQERGLMANEGLVT